MKTNRKPVNGLTTPVELVRDIDFVLHLQHFRPWPTDRFLMSHPARNEIKVPTGLPLAAKGNLEQDLTLTAAKEELAFLPFVCSRPQCCLFSCGKFQWVDARIRDDRPSRSCGTVGWSKVSVGWPDTNVCVCIFRRAALFQLGRCFIWSRPAAWRVACTCLASPPLSASATTLHIWHSLAITSTQ